MIRIPVSILAISVTVALCGACSKGGTDANDTSKQAAPTAPPAPQAPAIVQPGAPGQDSAAVAKVPTFNDNVFSDADTKFMQGMIHHHNQALLMVAMIPTHTDTVQLQQLGQKIQISQTGEIQAMKDWLTDRHKEVPMLHADGSAMMGNMDMTMMPGMLTPEQMKALDAARGAQFDTLFLTGMIQHHKGALSMVSDLRASGSGHEPNIAAFINGVDNDQRMEIVRMYGLLGRPVELP
jgi:uncharacterized protein (DUF305 family)